MKKYIYCIAFLLIQFSIYPVDLTSLTLTEFKRYASNEPDYPPADDLNWLDPDYSSLHVHLTPNFIQRMLQKFHLLSPRTLKADLFVDLLQQLLKDRTALEFAKKPVITVTCNHEETQFFVWGSCHGAFHSLVRCLDWLSSKDIIDDNLIIKNPHHFFVFTGDAINRSAYSMEILTLIFTLMLKNPNNIFYMKGTQETNQYWQNYGLKRQMQIRAHYLSGDAIPFAKCIDDLFFTLPSILYINRIEKPEDVILIYSPGIKPNFNPLIDSIYVQNITQPGVLYQQAHALDKPSDTPLYIEAVIRKEDWLKENRAVDGLGFADQVFGTTCWVVRSSPTAAYKTFYDFTLDAFAIIDIGAPLSLTTIGICNHPAEEKVLHFTHHTPYNIITGRPTTFEPAAPVGKDIVIGSTMSLEQGIPVVGQRVKQGIDVAINEQNRKGGIHGKHIRLDIRYDKYTPNLSRLNIKKMLAEGTNIILAPVGDPNLNAYIDYIKKGEILVLFPISGSPKFRQEDLIGIAHISASYADGVRNMVEYQIAEYASRQFAFFYQDDEAGFEPVNSAHQILTKHDMPKWLDLPYARGNVNFSEQVQKIKQGQVDTIGLFSTSYSTKEFLRQLDTETISNKTFFGSFLLGDASFREFSNRNGFHVLLGARVPNPAISEFPIIKEYREVMDKYDYAYDPFSLESYIGTRLTIELLKTIEGDITQEKLRAVVESLNNYEFGGFNYTFNPKTRSMARYIWLTTQEDEPWMQRDIRDTETLVAAPEKPKEEKK